jgi:hypothetical protein
MPSGDGVWQLGYMGSQMSILAGLPAHPADAGAGASFLVVHWDAAGVVACCVVLLCWWVRDQNAKRCPDCGYAPMWCRCPRPESRVSHRDRDHHER